MGANDEFIKMTVRVRKDSYLRMHAITEARGADHNAFVNQALDRHIAVEEKAEAHRSRLLRKQA